MAVMSKEKPKPTAKDRGNVLYVRLDDDTEAALVEFINSQDVPPDRQAVGLKAVQEFLTKRGFWPRKPK